LAGGLTPIPVAAADFTLQVPVKIVNLAPQYANNVTVWGSVHTEKNMGGETLAAVQVPVNLTNYSYNGTVTVLLNAKTPADRAKAKYYFVSLNVNGFPIGLMDPKLLNESFDQSKPMVLIQQGLLSGEQLAITPDLIHSIKAKFPVSN
jgi:hypothetical protein